MSLAEGAFSTIAVSFDGPVGTITLNRPDKLNALTLEMADELQDALTMVAGSAAVRCIVLTGAGRAFCAGADVGLLKEIHDRKDVATGRRILERSRGIHTII